MLPLPQGGVAQVIEGDLPLILAQPHVGTWLPEDHGLTPLGASLSDTDWHIDRLYDGLIPGATVVAMRVHRYGIDANRGPEDQSLYPGQNTTGLVPETDFDGRPILARPVTDLPERLAAWHAPYHAALAAQIARLRARHPHVILWDCHSIRSRIPYLFEGVLPDLNLGTFSGRSCAPTLAARVMEIAAASGFSHVQDGRFKGGWTTRHYGQPTEGVHALQMEIAQSAYLRAEAPPWTLDPARAEPLRATLRAMLTALLAACPSL